METKRERIDKIKCDFPRAPTAGYIYAIYSPTFSNFIKIGRTIDPSKRYCQYLDYNPHCDWRIEYITKIFEDSIEVETKLIARLYKKQICVKYNREYFDVKDKDKIIETIQELEEEFD
jgi:hypothetical protein